MEQETTYAIIGAVIIIAAITFGFLILRKFSQKVNIFIRDTMKEKQPDGYWKWSKTALTMASAWYAVLFAFFFDIIKNEKVNMEFVIIMVSVAIGGPISSAFAKKLSPLTNGSVKINETEPKI